VGEGTLASKSPLGLAGVGAIEALTTEFRSSSARLKEARKLLFRAWGMGPVAWPS